MSDLALRPRSATELVDAAVRLVRATLGPCVTIGLVLAIPQLGFGIVQALAVGDATGAVLAPDNAFTLMLVGFVVTILFHAVGDGALFRVLDGGLRGEPVGADEAVRRALPRAPGLLGTYLLVMLCWFASLLALVVPGLYVGARLWTAFAASALEGRAPFGALGTAWRRSRGRVLHSLGAIALVMVLYFALFFGSWMLGGALALVSPRAMLLATVTLQAAAAVLLYPVLIALMVVLHYDLRVRSEGYDLTRMLDALDELDRPGVAGGPSPVGVRDPRVDAPQGVLGDARR